MSDGAPWRILVTPRAEKDLKRVPLRDQDRIRAAVDALVTNPRVGDVRKLRGARDEWRLRVGDWRVRFRLDQTTRLVALTRVLPRARAYRD